MLMVSLPALLSWRPSRSNNLPDHHLRFAGCVSSTVTPSASAAAIIRFSVPVTLTRSNNIRAPSRRPPVLAHGYNRARYESRSHRLQPLIWQIHDASRSRRRRQRDHRFAEARASGPSTRIAARMVFTMSYGLRVCRYVPRTIPSACRSLRSLTPICCSRCTSCDVVQIGTLSIAADRCLAGWRTNIGSAAFLARKCALPQPTFEARATLYRYFCIAYFDSATLAECSFIDSACISARSCPKSDRPTGGVATRFLPATPH